MTEYDWSYFEKSVIFWQNILLFGVQILALKLLINYICFIFENKSKKLILELAGKVQAGIFSLWGKRQSTADLRHRQFRLEA